MAKASSGTGRKAGGGLARPVTPSSDLAAIVGDKIKRGALLPRKSEVSAPADPIAAVILASRDLVRLIGPPVSPRAGATLPRRSV